MSNGRDGGEGQTKRRRGRERGNSWRIAALKKKMDRIVLTEDTESEVKRDIVEKILESKIAIIESIFYSVFGIRFQAN